MKRCIGFEEVHSVTSLSRTHINRLETDPEFMGDDPFPKRRCLGFGKCRVCWWLHEVLEWLERRSTRR